MTQCGPDRGDDREDESHDRNTTRKERPEIQIRQRIGEDGGKCTRGDDGDRGYGCT